MRLKVAILSRCIGLGGADGMFLNLLRHSVLLECVGYVTEQPIRHKEWIDCAVPGLKIYEGLDKIPEAIKNAEVVLCWNIEKYKQYFDPESVLTIEIAQNYCAHEQFICLSNIESKVERVAVSNFAKKSFGEKEATILPNGVDPCRIAPKYGRTITREMWGATDENKILLHCGRMAEEKHPQVLLKIIADLPNNWRLIYCGHSSDHLKEMVRRLKLTEKIYFASYRYHIGDILQASDVFILLSDFEGLSLSVLEAWLSGTPVVTNRIESIIELETRFNHALTYSVNSIFDDLVEVVQKAEQDPDELVQLAQVIVWNNFTIPTVAMQWENFILNKLHIYRMKKLQTHLECING